MKKIIFLFSIVSFAQVPPLPIGRIFDFPNIRILSVSGGGISGEHCGIWFHSPTPPQTQIACYAQDGSIPKNEIVTPPPTGMNGGFSFADGGMEWILTNNTYSIVVQPRGNSDISGTAVFGAQINEKGTY